MIQHIMSQFADAKLGAVLSLAVSMKDVRTNDLTLDHLEAIAQALGMRINVSESLKDEIVAALRADDIDRLADVMAKPELFDRIMPILLSAQGPDEHLILRNCKICGALNEYTLCLTQ